MRILNSLKNISTGMIYFFLNTILGFISRTIFIKVLGQTYLGVNGLVSNVISMLSLAELGISTAINFSLYKPLSEKDDKKIALLMKFYKKAYSIIGIVVFIIGLCITIFSDYLVKDSANIKEFKLILFLNVINVSLSYFMTYKTTLLNADQKGYKLLSINIVFNILNIFLQIVALITTKNYIIYIVVNMIVLIFQRIYTNKMIDDMYDVLEYDTDENLDKNELLLIIKNVKAMIFHKIGSFCINGTDNIIISHFINIKTVGLYSNYSMLIAMISNFGNMIFNSITSSMGNLIATDEGNKRLEVFKKINFIAFWFYSVTAICLFNLINPFIKLWLGSNFIISRDIIFIVLLNYYLTGMRVPLAIVKSSAGIYNEDKYIPLIQSALNLVISIVLVKKIGLLGVFIGTLLSGILTVNWYRAFITYKYVFNTSVKSYYKLYFKYFCVFIFIGYISSLFMLKINTINSIYFMQFVISSIFCFIFTNILLIFIMKDNENFLYIKNIIINILEGLIKNVKKG